MKLATYLHDGGQSFGVLTGKVCQKAGGGEMIFDVYQLYSLSVRGSR